MLRFVLIPVATLVFSLLINGGKPAPESTITFYPDHLTDSFTGGFGEETCRSCHFDYDLNPGGGTLTVLGIGKKISAGQKLEIEISAEREDLGAAGFQLSARDENGTQAGKFNLGDNDRIMFSKSIHDSLQYVQHTSEGSKPDSNYRQTWMVAWKAPESFSGPIIFNIAANAANGDQSEFGDFIYVEEIVTELE